MAYVGHHTQDAAHVAVVLQVNDRNAATASHTSYQQIAAVGREDRSAECVTALVVAVHGHGGGIVERQDVVNDQTGFVVPVFGFLGTDVDEPHGVVAPMGYGNGASIGRSGNHLGQRARFHEAHNLVGLCVNDGYCRRILCVDVVCAAIIRHPEIAAVVTERALYGFAHEMVVLGIMGEGVKVGRLAPQVVVLGT